MTGEIETEVVYYAKISNPAGLDKADSIRKHDQVEGRFMNGNKVRVRKESAPDGTNTSFTFTGKRKQNSAVEGTSTVQESVEFDAPVDEAFMNVFIETAEQRMLKTRYYFKNRSIKLVLAGQEMPIVIDNVGFEVDVFDTKGTPCEYAKIDVELDPIIKYLGEHHPDVVNFGLKIISSTLPFGPVDVIYPPTASDEQKAMIENLWRTQFTTQLNSAEPPPDPAQVPTDPPVVPADDTPPTADAPPVAPTEGDTSAAPKPEDDVVKEDDKKEAAPAA